MKPSEAYIAHILARPEFAARLNQEWEPHPGDWYFDTRLDEPGLIWLESGQPIDELVFADKDRLQWLPSLSQLLAMVEAMGLDYALARFEGEYSVTAYQARPTEEDLDWEEVHKGRSLWGMEIAAASLLERLWEEA